MEGVACKICLHRVAARVDRSGGKRRACRTDTDEVGERRCADFRTVKAEDRTGGDELAAVVDSSGPIDGDCGRGVQNRERRGTDGGIHCVIHQNGNVKIAGADDPQGHQGLPTECRQFADRVGELPIVRQIPGERQRIAVRIGRSRGVDRQIVTHRDRIRAAGVGHGRVVHASNGDHHRGQVADSAVTVGGFEGEAHITRFILGQILEVATRIEAERAVEVDCHATFTRPADQSVAERGPVVVTIDVIGHQLTSYR